MKLPKQSKLSLTLRNVPRAGIIGISYIGEGINEIMQELKHGYYHLTNQNHKKIKREDFDNNCYFCDYNLIIKTPKINE